MARPVDPMRPDDLPSSGDVVSLCVEALRLHPTFCDAAVEYRQYGSNVELTTSSGSRYVIYATRLS